MNLRDLEYFIAIAETQNFRKASEQCFVSQPTLSAQIKKLENELDVQLFERNNKSVILTKAGSQILPMAESIIEQAQALKSYAKLQQDPYTATIHLGIIPTIAPYLLPKVIGKIKRQLPKVKLYIHEEKTPDAIELLRTGKLDAAIMALPIEESFLNAIKLYQEDFYVALPKDHSLTKKASLTINDIKKEDLLLLAEGHCLRDQALEVCHLQKNPGFYEAASLETLRYMVANGNGITLFPELACKPSHPLITIKPFKKPCPHRDIALFFRNETPLLSCFKKLASLLMLK
jgi:LysR family transcriptional regulator, hydrogen peroxide-inducible genes activator